MGTNEKNSEEDYLDRLLAQAMKQHNEIVNGGQPEEEEPAEAEELPAEEIPAEPEMSVPEEVPAEPETSVPEESPAETE